jgi:hypothetical protein
MSDSGRVPSDLQSIGFVYSSGCYGRHLLVGGKTIDESACRDCGMTFVQVTDEAYAEDEALNAPARKQP